jgi:hypothetical protein
MKAVCRKSGQKILKRKSGRYPGFGGYLGGAKVVKVKTIEDALIDKVG